MTWAYLPPEMGSAFAQAPQYFTGAESPTCCERPTADFSRPSIGCGAASPDRPFMRSAAFSWLKHRSADKVSFRCKCTNVSFGGGGVQKQWFLVRQHHLAELRGSAADSLIPHSKNAI